MNNLETHLLKTAALLLLVIAVIGAAGCGQDSPAQVSQEQAPDKQALQKDAAKEETDWEELKVLASSYTLSEKETKKGNIGISAFGERLKPEMRAVAVSRDLLKQGLTYGTRIRIEGLEGVYTVRDKMNKRWKKKIDILFKKRGRALEWGRQKVTIEWRPPAGAEG